MMTRIRKASASLALGYMVEAVAVFVRSVIVARLLGPENVGIAATFLLIIGMVGLFTDLGIERYLLHVRQDDLPLVQPSLYTVLIVRGLLGGAAIALLSGQIAQLFGLEDLVHIYLFAALFPIIGAFKSLDPMRRQRDLVYGPSIAADLTGMLVNVTVSIALAWTTQSYMSVVWGTLIGAATTTVLSHLLAAEPYRPGWNPDAVRGLFTYGLPLTLNGVLIFVGNQGDRFLIGVLEGVSDLALYVAVGTLTTNATQILAKLTSNLYLPILSAVRDDPEAFARRSRICGTISLGMVFTVMVPMMFLASPLVTLLFGEAYRVSVELGAWLSVAAAARLFSIWPITAALGLGTTVEILAANIVRSSGFGFALWAALAGFGAVGVAAGIAVGEILAVLYLLFRSDLRSPVPVRTGKNLAMLFLGTVGLALAVIETGMMPGGWLGEIGLGALIASIGVLVLVVMGRDLWPILVRNLRAS